MATEIDASAKPRKTRRKRPRPLPVHAVVEPFELRNNWSLRRAGLWGRRVVTRFDGEALCLEGTRRGALRIAPRDVRRLLVGYEEFEGGCYYRAVIRSSATIFPITLRLRWGGIRSDEDPVVWAGYASVVREIAWGLQQCGEFGRVRIGHRKLFAFGAPLLIILILVTIASLEAEELPNLDGETPLSAAIAIGAVLLAFGALFAAVVRSGFHRRVRNVAALDEVLPTKSRSVRFR